MLQFQHSRKANTGQTQWAIFYTEKLKKRFFSTEGNNILLEFLFENTRDVKFEQRQQLLCEISRNNAKICENFEFMRKRSNYANSHNRKIHGALRMIDH